MYNTTVYYSTAEGEVNIGTSKHSRIFTEPEANNCFSINLICEHQKINKQINNNNNNNKRAKKENA